MQKQLIVNLRADGSVAAETIGMTGDECLAYISELEDLLDATTTSSSYTSDYAAVSGEVAAEQHDEDRRR
ncbi:hypothetical protein FM104_12405 [Microbacterium esteraromaticum]|uniref:DUF2997 domain-containing protein n=1 Tax=Microbacterium esteraromaticum TaxID=57043 RepID=A0A1R4KFY9_9MICO|nr:DUF2997 domain-containing protein [Microbacterium esteraromaticum]SJN43142.1 hypothetical protein FM104_12405 [Microbacterium esteraromaticum]